MLANYALKVELTPVDLFCDDQRPFISFVQQDDAPFNATIVFTMDLNSHRDSSAKLAEVLSELKSQIQRQLGVGA